MTQPGIRRGFVAGLFAGAATAGAMYLAADLAGIRPLPALLEEPVLAAMPGPVFGFLIDRLQHLGKVLEEIGLLVAMVAGLGVLGAGYAAVRQRSKLPALNLVAGAVAWAVVCFGFLPIAGEGLLGLNTGPVTPIAWALLFTVYATVLEAAARPAPPHNSGRRDLLRAVPAGAALAGAAYIALRVGPRWYATAFGSPEAGAAGPPTAITPVDRFYVVSKNFTDPVVAAQGWSLVVGGGSAGAPYRLSLDELRALPAVEQVVTLECISNTVGGLQMSTGRFGGVPLRDLVQRAQPRSDAAWVVFKSRDGYSEFLPLAMVQSRPDILVAHALAGAPLPNAHGFPARVLVPGSFGMKGPKWLDSIELAAARSGGYWEGQGWNPDATVRTTARIDIPADGDIVRAGTAVMVAGVAFAGTRGISRVEFSSDGGSSWTPAVVEAPPGPLAWSLWSFPWTPSNGSHVLVARAVDGNGEPQDATVRPSYPNGSSGYHKIRVAASGT